MEEGQEHFAVKTLERAGLPVRVTSLERTLVDALDQPDLGGGWEEIWRSLETIEFFDLDGVVQYTLLLDNATTAAKVGFFLGQHKETLMVESPTLSPCAPIGRVSRITPIIAKNLPETGVTQSV